MSSEFEIKSKKKFKLTKSSKIYLLVVLILAGIGLLSAISRADLSAHQAGQVLGRVLAYVIFPSLIGWIVWLVSGKKENGGNVTFKLILTLMILSNIVKTINEGDSYKEKKMNNYLNEVKENKNEFKKFALNNDDPKKFNENYKKYESSVYKSIDKISKLSNKKEQKIINIFKKSLKDMSESTNSWHKAVDAIENERMLNFSLLKKDKEFDYRKKIVNDYITKTEKHKKYFLTILKY